MGRGVFLKGTEASWPLSSCPLSPASWLAMWALCSGILQNCHMAPPTGAQSHTRTLSQISLRFCKLIISGIFCDSTVKVTNTGKAFQLFSYLKTRRLPINSQDVLITNNDSLLPHLLTLRDNKGIRTVRDQLHFSFRMPPNFMFWLFFIKVLQYIKVIFNSVNSEKISSIVSLNMFAPSCSIVLFRSNWHPYANSYFKSMAFLLVTFTFFIFSAFISF